MADRTPGDRKPSSPRQTGYPRDSQLPKQGTRRVSSGGGSTRQSQSPSGQSQSPPAKEASRSAWNSPKATQPPWNSPNTSSPVYTTRTGLRAAVQSPPTEKASDQSLVSSTRADRAERGRKPSLSESRSPPKAKGVPATRSGVVPKSSGSSSELARRTSPKSSGSSGRPVPKSTAKLPASAGKSAPLGAPTPIPMQRTNASAARAGYSTGKAGSATETPSQSTPAKMAADLPTSPMLETSLLSNAPINSIAPSEAADLSPSPMLETTPLSNEAADQAVHSSSKEKGRLALLKGLRSGEVTKIVDKMEESPTEQTVSEMSAPSAEVVAEAERQRVAEEQRLRAEAERQRLEEERRLELERQQAAMERQAALEQQWRAQEAERKRVAEEQRLRVEAERRQLEEARRLELERQQAALARQQLEQAKTSSNVPTVPLVVNAPLPPASLRTQTEASTRVTPVVSDLEANAQVAPAAKGGDLKTPLLAEAALQSDEPPKKRRCCGRCCPCFRRKRAEVQEQPPKELQSDEPPKKRRFCGRCCPCSRRKRAEVKEQPPKELQSDEPPKRRRCCGRCCPCLRRKSAEVEEQPPKERGVCRGLCRLLCKLIALVLIVVCSAGPSFLALATEKVMQVPLVQLPTMLSQIDHTLRATGHPSYCIVAEDAKDGSEVGLGSCDRAASENIDFYLADDGTISLMSEPSLCLTAVSSGEIELADCSANAQQVWNFHGSGVFELKSKAKWCMKSSKDDVKTGKLGLYPCDLGFGSLFSYGGGHFLVPGLVEKVHYYSNYLRKMYGCYLLLLIMLLVISSWLCCGISSVVRTLEAGCKRRFLRFLITCIIIVLGAQYLGLVYAGYMYRELGSLAFFYSPTSLDYTLRMSSFPDYCVTSEDTSPFVVSMESCKVGNQAQQFIMESKDGEDTIRLKARRDLCISLDKDEVRLDRCDASSASRQTFTDARGTGGSLPLANTDKCLNLLSGDITRGSLGFYPCSGDPNQVFFYSQGNPTVARLLDQMQALSDAASVFNVKDKLEVQKSYLKIGLSLCIGVCLAFLCLWMKYK